MASDPNPKSQQSIGKKLGISRQLANYHLHKTLGFKTVHKTKCHRLTEVAMDQRKRRSWPLYLRLNNDGWRKFITSDEALFRLDESSGQTKIQYLRSDQSRSEAEPFIHREHSKSVMVWVAMSANGLSRPLFIDSNVKINHQVYIDKVLKPFIRVDLPKLYPDGDYVFQQDSAHSHRSNKVAQFLKEKKIKYLPPQEWMANSPDAAPCDYFLWGYLKNRLSRQRITDVHKLKLAIRREIKSVPIEFIQNAMKSWPSRCRKIYESNGANIEHKR